MDERTCLRHCILRGWKDLGGTTSARRERAPAPAFIVLTLGGTQLTTCGVTEPTWLEKAQKKAYSGGHSRDSMRSPAARRKQRTCSIAAIALRNRMRSPVWEYGPERAGAMGHKGEVLFRRAGYDEPGNVPADRSRRRMRKAASGQVGQRRN